MHMNLYTIPILVKDIEAQINEGWASVRNLESINMAYGFGHDSDEELEYEEEVFKSKIEHLRISLSLLLEIMGKQSFLINFLHDLESFKGKETVIRSVPFTAEPHSDVLGLFWSYFRPISLLFSETDVSGSDEVRQRERFASILQNTDKIVHDRGIEPKNEAEVRKCVYDLLIHVFPDTVREIPIAQVTKTYKPDIGVRSLRAAAEYKYATTEQEAKKVIGGFYEDMKGYGGSEDWKFFYAVVYMTKPFFTIQQIQAEFDAVGVEHWTPIIVHGNGTRGKTS